MGKKVTFIIGSGTSIESGAPSFDGFNSKIREIWKQKAIQDNNYMKEAFSNVLKLIKKYPQSNIEEIFSFVYLDNQFNLDSSKLLEHIEFVIGKTIYESLRYIEGNDSIKLSKNQRNLIKQIALCGCDFDIISLNWDVLLDQALMHSRVGLSAFGKKKLNTGTLNYGFLTYYNKKEVKPKDKGILLKPHGSMNWGYCEKCEKVFFTNNKMHIYFNPSNEETCLECEDRKLSKLIIPPVYNKFASIEHTNNIENTNKKDPAIFKIFLKIWNKVYDVIKDSDIVVIVGYSFPKTDIEFLTFFKKAVYDRLGEKRDDDGGLDILVADYNPDPIVKKLSEEFNYYINDGTILQKNTGAKIIKESSIRIHSVKTKFGKFAREFKKIIAKFS